MASSRTPQRSRTRRIARAGPRVTRSAEPPEGPVVDPDALLCALILAPRTFSRNRFFELYEQPLAKKARRRAGRVRSIIRQLAGQGEDRAEITGEQVLDDGRVLIRYQVSGLALRRTAALSRIEAAALHYALHRAGAGPLDQEDRDLIEQALDRLGQDLDVRR